MDTVNDDVMVMVVELDHTEISHYIATFVSVLLRLKCACEKLKFTDIAPVFTLTHCLMCKERKKNACKINSPETLREKCSSHGFTKNSENIGCEVLIREWEQPESCFQFLYNTWLRASSRYLINKTIKNPLRYHSTPCVLSKSVNSPGLANISRAVPSDLSSFRCQCSCCVYHMSWQPIRCLDCLEHADTIAYSNPASSDDLSSQ